MFNFIIFRYEILPVYFFFYLFYFFYQTLTPNIRSVLTQNIIIIITRFWILYKKKMQNEEKPHRYHAIEILKNKREQ